MAVKEHFPVWEGTMWSRWWTRGQQTQERGWHRAALKLNEAEVRRIRDRGLGYAGSLCPASVVGLGPAVTD